MLFQILALSIQITALIENLDQFNRVCSKGNGVFSDKGIKAWLCLPSLAKLAASSPTSAL